MELPDFFGLDIGDHSVKLAQLKRKGDSSADILKVGMGNLTHSLLENDQESVLDKIAEQLKAAKDAAGMSTINCVAAMPESPIFSRMITVPKVAEDQLEQTVHWELKPLIPVPLDEVDIAFLEVDQSEQDGKQVINVYAVASPKKLVARYQQVCEKAGFNLIALETESLANTRLTTFNYGVERSAMVVDFGSHGTDVVLAREGIPIFAQSISTGSDALTKAIAADYGISVPQAEQYKKAYGINFEAGDGKIARSIEPIMQLLTSEMSRTLTYLRQKVSDTENSRMYLVGDGANLPGLPAYIKQQLGLEAILVNPLQNISANRGVQQELEQANITGYSVAMGLGLKDR